MGTLRLAANYISRTPGFGHLQIVNFNGDLSASQELEVQMPLEISNFSIFWGVWDFPPVRTHGGVNTPYFGEDGYYKSIDIDLGTRNSDDVWQILLSVHEQLRLLSPNIPYDIYQNSNSYVNTLLSIVGIDLGKLESSVRPEGVSSFPGIKANVLGVDPEGMVLQYPQKPYQISLNIKGTDGDDTINTGMFDDLLAGGAGKDTLRGGAGKDVLVGGSGAVSQKEYTKPYLEWEDGVIDVLAGGQGQDKYLVFRSTLSDEAHTREQLLDALKYIDIIDERKGDGLGDIVIQHQQLGSGPVNLL